MIISNIFNKEQIIPKAGDDFDDTQFFWFPKKMRLAYSEEWETRWLQTGTIRVIYKEDYFNLPGGLFRKELVKVECCWIDDRDDRIPEMSWFEKYFLTQRRENWY